MGRFPSGQREQTVNLPPLCFGGSNPPLPTTRRCVASRQGGGSERTGPEEGGQELTRGCSTGNGGCGEGPVARWFFTPAGRRRRGSSSGVEHQPSKLRVAGSNPVSRSMASFPGPRGSVVEHFLGKEGVTGSIPVVGSTFRMTQGAEAPPDDHGARDEDRGLRVEWAAVSGGSRWPSRNSRGRSRT